MIKPFPNCKTRSTGLSKPHTIYIDSQPVSIVHTNKLNKTSIEQYYFDKLKMKKYATATDTFGETYTIYINLSGIIAIPDKPVKRGYY